MITHEWRHHLLHFIDYRRVRGKWASISPDGKQSPPLEDIWKVKELAKVLQAFKEAISTLFKAP